MWWAAKKLCFKWSGTSVCHNQQATSIASWLSSSIDRACVCSFGCSTQQTSFENDTLFPRFSRNRLISLHCLGEVLSLHTERNFVGCSSHGCRLTSGLSQRYSVRPRGLMDKASVSEAEDCGFESRRGYKFFAPCKLDLQSDQKSILVARWFWWDSNSCTFMRTVTPSSIVIYYA